MPDKRDYPIWETLVMVVSFVLLWAWLFARHAAQMHKRPLSIGWTALQILACLVLIAIFVRRMRRVKNALHENDPRHRMNQPSDFSGKNGRPKK